MVAGDVVFGLGDIGAGGIVLEVLLHLVDVGSHVGGSLLGGLKGEALNLVHVDLGRIGDAIQELAELGQLSAVGINELHVLGSGLSLVAGGILADNLLVGLDGGILLVHALVDQSGLEQTLAGLDALGVVLQQGGIGAEGVIVLAQQGLCIALLEHGLRSEVALGIGCDEGIHLVDFIGILVIEAHHHAFLIHRVVAAGVLAQSHGLVVGHLGATEVASIVLGVADAVIGVGHQVGAQLLAGYSILESRFGLGIALLLIEAVAQVVLCQAVVLVTLVDGLDILLLVLGSLLEVTFTVLGLGQPQAALVESGLVVVTHGDGLLEVLVGLLIAVVGHGLHTHVVEDALLGLEHLGARLVDAVDASEGALVVGGAHVGIDQVVLHIILITRVGILVDKVLEQVHTLVKRCACALAHADGIVVVGRLPDALVTIHHGCLLEGHVGTVQVVELPLGLSHVQIGALGQGIAAVGHMQHVVDHGLVVAVAVVEHAHGVGSGAVRLTLGVVQVAAQVGTRLAVVAQMVVALAHDAVELGVKVVVAMLVKQSRAGGNHVVIVFLVILNLGEVVL